MTDLMFQQIVCRFLAAILRRLVNIHTGKFYDAEKQVLIDAALLLDKNRYHFLGMEDEK